MELEEMCMGDINVIKTTYMTIIYLIFKKNDSDTPWFGIITIFSHPSFPPLHKKISEVFTPTILTFLNQ